MRWIHRKVLKHVCKRRLVFLMVVFVVILYFCDIRQIYLPEPKPPETLTMPINMDKHTTQKRILFYDECHWWDDWVDKKWESTELFRHCEISDCIVSRDRLKYNNSDAVMFKYKSIKHIPVTRPSTQVWILGIFEAPRFPTHHIIKKLRNKLNWIIGYRRDADINVPYGGFRTHKNQNKHNKFHFKKYKMAVGFISHCRAPSNRDIFIRKLRKVIDVDIYGACGNKRCGDNELQNHKDTYRNPNETSQSHKKCFSVLDTTYKYYLSFENIFCKDYISEKSLQKVMSHQIIPVVRSGANHSLYHPPNSVINTNEFKNISELGYYLLSLGNESHKYWQYFDWRKYYYVEGTYERWDAAMCDVCKRLHTKEHNKRIYHDIYKWLVTPNAVDACRKPDDLE